MDDIFENPGFESFFDENASKPVNSIFPTFTIRQVMWALRMKPLKKQPWETAFDHKPI